MLCLPASLPLSRLLGRCGPPRRFSLFFGRMYCWRVGARSTGPIRISITAYSSVSSLLLTRVRIALQEAQAAAALMSQVAQPLLRAEAPERYPVPKNHAHFSSSAVSVVRRVCFAIGPVVPAADTACGAGCPAG